MLSYFYWKGRMSRFVYFNIQLILLFLTVIIVVTTLPLIYESNYDPAYVESMANVQFYTNVLSVVVIYMDICAKVRRYHDFGYPAWHLLWLLIPVVNLYFFILLFLKKGAMGANRYGPDPVKRNTTTYKESA